MNDGDFRDGDGIPRREIYEYLEAPLRRPFHVLIPLVLVFGAATASSFIAPKKYQSSTLLMVESEKMPESYVQKMATMTPAQRMNTIKQEILSRTRLENIIRELNPYPGLMHQQRMQDIVEAMRNNINIRVRGNDAFGIEYTHSNPVMAQKVCDRLATLFIEETAKSREEQVTEAHQFIEAQLEEARAELDEVEEQMRVYRERYMGALPQQLSANLGTLQRLQLELQTLNQNHEAAQDRKVVLEKNLTEEVQKVPLVTPQGSSGPATPTSLGAELSKLRGELALLRSRYTEEHPEVKRVLSQLTRLEKELTDATTVARSDQRPPDPVIIANPAVASIRRQIQQVELDVQAIQDKRADVETRITEYQAKVERTPRVEQELTALTRDYQKVQDNYNGLMKKKMEAQMAQSMEKRWRGEFFRMLDPAFLPERHIYPDRFLFMSGGLTFGLLLGLGTALGFEFLDRSIKNVRELETLLPCPVLVTIPHVRSGKASQEAPSDGLPFEPSDGPSGPEVSVH